MRNYDASFIFSPNLAEQEANDNLQQMASFVQEKGGILGEQQLKGKRPLLAPIGKHREGYLATFSFTLSPEHLEEFEKKAKEEQQILRFLLAKQPKKARKPEPVRHLQPALSPAPAAEAPQETPTAEEPTQEKPERTAEEKVDLKDIDEKLEEIFKEA